MIQSTSIFDIFFAGAFSVFIITKIYLRKETDVDKRRWTRIIQNIAWYLSLGMLLTIAAVIFNNLGIFKMGYLTQGTIIVYQNWLSQLTLLYLILLIEFLMIYDTYAKYYWKKLIKQENSSLLANSL